MDTVDDVLLLFEGHGTQPMDRLSDIDHPPAPLAVTQDDGPWPLEACQERKYGRVPQGEVRTGYDPSLCVDHAGKTGLPDGNGANLIGKRLKIGQGRPGGLPS